MEVLKEKSEIISKDMNNCLVTNIDICYDIT